jgi:hypothetical protein
MMIGLYYTAIRKAVRLSKGDKPALPPTSASEIKTVIQAANLVLLAAVSFGLLVIILRLMIFKPF